MTAVENVLSGAIMLAVGVALIFGSLYGAYMMIFMVVEVWQPLFGRRKETQHQATVAHIVALEKELFGQDQHEMEKQKWH